MSGDRISEAAGCVQPPRSIRLLQHKMQDLQDLPQDLLGGAVPESGVPPVQVQDLALLAQDKAGGVLAGFIQRDVQREAVVGIADGTELRHSWNQIQRVIAPDNKGRTPAGLLVARLGIQGDIHNIPLSRLVHYKSSFPTPSPVSHSTGV